MISKIQSIENKPKDVKNDTNFDIKTKDRENDNKMCLSDTLIMNNETSENTHVDIITEAGQSSTKFRQTI